MVRPKILAAVSYVALIVSASYAQEPSDRQYKLDANCRNVLVILGKFDNSTDTAITSALPDTKAGKVTIIASIGSGTGSIQQGKMRWNGVNAHSFLAHSKDSEGKLVRTRIGLIEKVVSPAGVANVAFEEASGKPLSGLGEVWIEKTSNGTHLELAAALGDSPVFFIDGVTPVALERAVKNRAFIEQKLIALSKRNSTLLYALPRNEEHLAGMGFKTANLTEWSQLADRVDALGLRQIRPTGSSNELIQVLIDELANGRNVLVWAHSPDGQRLAIPVRDSDGNHSINLLTASEVAYVQQEVAKVTKNPGLLVIHGCRIACYRGLAQHIVGTNAPVVTPREEFANANIDVLEEISKTGNVSEKTKQRKKKRNAPPNGPGNAPPGGPNEGPPDPASPRGPSASSIGWFTKLAGNLTVLVAVGLSDDDDDEKKKTKDMP